MPASSLLTTRGFIIPKLLVALGRASISSALCLRVLNRLAELASFTCAGDCDGT